MLANDTSDMYDVKLKALSLDPLEDPSWEWLSSGHVLVLTFSNNTFHASLDNSVTVHSKVIGDMSKEDVAVVTHCEVQRVIYYYQDIGIWDFLTHSLTPIQCPRRLYAKLIDNFSEEIARTAVVSLVEYLFPDAVKDGFLCDFLEEHIIVSFSEPHFTHWKLISLTPKSTVLQLCTAVNKTLSGILTVTNPPDFTEVSKGDRMSSRKPREIRFNIQSDVPIDITLLGSFNLIVDGSARKYNYDVQLEGNGVTYDITKKYVFDTDPNLSGVVTNSVLDTTMSRVLGSTREF